MRAAAAHHFEVAIIGGGAIGLSIGRALALKGKEVLILERNKAVGAETSSRSSEVIHAGLYYPNDSLKARFCVSGKEELYRYCKARDIPFSQTGKLIVATQESQLKNDLLKLRQKAEANGVDVRILSREETNALEPEVDCVGALFSPTTGVFDSHSFMVAMQHDAEKHGAIVVLNSKVTTYRLLPTGIELNIDGVDVSALNVVNASGLWAHNIASELHRDTRWKPPTQYFAKGNYFRLKGSSRPFQRPIYPIPEPGGLGIHATVDWAHSSTKFGPDVQWLDASVQPDDIDFSCDESRVNEFYRQVKKYWPNIQGGDLVPDYAGVRPKLHHPNHHATPGQLPFVDFYLAQPSEHGVKGLFHCLGMESPGLTSSLAIASEVADKIIMGEMYS